MADVFLYLTTTGRTTGQPREIEIWFVEHANHHYLVAQNREQSQWVQNLQADPQISFCVGTREDHGAVRKPHRGHGRVVDVEREPELVAAVKALMDKKYNWSDGLVVELGS